MVVVVVKVILTLVFKENCDGVEKGTGDDGGKAIVVVRNYGGGNDS